MPASGCQVNHLANLISTIQLDAKSAGRQLAVATGALSDTLNLPKLRLNRSIARVMIETPTDLQAVTRIMGKPKKNHKMG